MNVFINNNNLLPVVGVLAPVHLLNAMLLSVELSLDQVQVPSVVLSRAPSHTEARHGTIIIWLHSHLPLPDTPLVSFLMKSFSALVLMSTSLALLVQEQSELASSQVF